MANPEVSLDRLSPGAAERWPGPEAENFSQRIAEDSGELTRPFGPARTRIRVETRHLAFLDGLAARVRIENNGRLSRAELFAILVRVLLSAGLDPEKVRSESALVELLHERACAHQAAADDGI